MSKNVKMTNSMKVITGPNTRWSYANVWEPKSINGGTPKYSVSLIIPKSDTKTVAKIKTAIEAAYREGEAKLKGNGKSVPALSVLKTPLRDGDLERPDDPAYAGSYFVNANATSAPGIVDADRNPILTRSEVYSGVYGRASISFYAFNSSGNKGIACGLNNLQKIRDGEPLGGKASAESDFATDDDDDFLDYWRWQAMNTITISTILVNICIGCFACVGLTTAISMIQSIINDHKREKREQGKDKRDLEYHEKRMKDFK